MRLPSNIGNMYYFVSVRMDTSRIFTEALFTFSDILRVRLQGDREAMADIFPCLHIV